MCRKCRKCYFIGLSGYELQVSSSVGISLGIGIDISRTDANTFTWVGKKRIYKMNDYLKWKMGEL